MTTRRAAREWARESSPLLLNSRGGCTRTLANMDPPARHVANTAASLRPLDGVELCQPGTNMVEELGRAEPGPSSTWATEASHGGRELGEGGDAPQAGSGPSPAVKFALDDERMAPMSPRPRRGTPKRSVAMAANRACDPDAAEAPRGSTDRTEGGVDASPRRGLPVTGAPESSSAGSADGPGDSSRPSAPTPVQSAKLKAVRPGAKSPGLVSRNHAVGNHSDPGERWAATPAEPIVLRWYHAETKGSEPGARVEKSAGFCDEL